jgi:hypothetical protein
MVAAVRHHHPPSNAGLNLLWSGLAQWCQGRYCAAAFFSIGTTAACAIFMLSPPYRALAVAGVCFLTAWSMLDAWPRS